MEEKTKAGYRQCNNMKCFLVFIFCGLKLLHVAARVTHTDEGCTAATASGYCPSSCVVEKEIQRFKTAAERNLAWEQQRFEEVRVMVSKVDANLTVSSHKPQILGALMRQEQELLKQRLQELERNATKQRQIMIDLVTKMSEQEKTVSVLFRQVATLEENCRPVCTSENGQNSNHYSPQRGAQYAECESEPCDITTFDITAVGLDGDTAEVCLEFDTPSAGSCADLFDIGYTKTGIYTISPESTSKSFRVFCDMEDDGGGWTVLQRRLDGSTSFNRTWKEYEEGFGNISCNREYWIGNKNMASLGLAGYQTAKFRLVDWNNEVRYAQYAYFKVNQKSHSYTLQISGYQEDLSNASDSMTIGPYPQNNMAFSTYDQNNIYSSVQGCRKGSGGWWFNACNTANLNGEYHQGSYNPASQAVGIIWTAWKGKSYSLKATEMKVRPFEYRER